MADNYIEKAMDDLRSGRFFSHSSTKRQYSRHVYIRDIEEYGIERVRELVRSGIKVSFSFPEGHSGSRLARTLKCFYRPSNMGKPDDAECYEP